MRKGIGMAIMGAAARLITLVAVVPAVSRGPTAALYALFALLAVAYTVPPLKSSHRGLGELDVALTHSAGAIVAGYVAQGGIWTGSVPWLLSLPLSLAILPSILLAGCPDRDADLAAGKRTLVVMLGKRAAIRLAMGACLAAPALAALMSMTSEDMAALLTWSAAGGAIHAAWLWRRLQRLVAKDIPERIDGPIVVALTFILWFCVPPLVVLMNTSGT
jgi:1,4-dihydroxy-2-naphthoate polyprenyltransferase